MKIHLAFRGENFRRVESPQGPISEESTKRKHAPAQTIISQEELNILVSLYKIARTSLTAKTEVSMAPNPVTVRIPISENDRKTILEDGEWNLSSSCETLNRTWKKEFTVLFRVGKL